MTASAPARIWCNYGFPDEVRALLSDECGSRLDWARALSSSNLTAGAWDEAMREADVLLGQPPPEALGECPRVRWIHLTSAGYERYAEPSIAALIAARGIALTTSSSVYAEPCAEHILAMMLGLARELPSALHHQRTDHGWPAVSLRRAATVLVGQRVVILGAGAIAHRLTELLAPFRMTVTMVRRRPVPGYATGTELPGLLAEADHVVDTLPGGRETRHFLDATRLGQIRPGARLYNVGRGTTIDEDALIEVMRQGRLDAAYLDVTAAEPLPERHPLWTTPRVFITPHIAGGQRLEHLRLCEHFLSNLARFDAAGPLTDQIAL